MPLSEAMKEIIEQAYRIFNRYPVPQQFEVCCACCVSPQEEQALRQTPLRDLPFELLNAYNQSATSQQQNSSEIRYLLPRLLEIIAHGQYPAVSGEIVLDRVGRAEPENWLPAERQILTEFARQFMADLLAEAQREARMTELDAILIMFHLGGLDVTPLLDSVLETPGFWAIASLAWTLKMERSHGRLTNGFAYSGKEEQLNQRLDDWISRSRLKLSARAAEAIISPADLTQEYARYCCRFTVGYWIEESLCVLHDCQV